MTKKIDTLADLILLVPRFGFPHISERNADEMEAELCCALCVEMKTSKGRQSPEQKEWQAKVENHGYKYAVCHSLDEFMNTINNYLT